MNRIKRLLTSASSFSMLVSMMLAFVFVSCSETEDNEEFSNWKQRNDEYFQSVYANAMARIAGGDSNWKILKKWSLGADNDSYHADVTDNVVVRVLESGTSTADSPLFTDTVRVAYRGHIIPSQTYTSGFVFDATYDGEFNKATAAAAKLAVADNVDGFVTALQHMKIGDRWEIYIPYNLGYGEQTQNNIPGCSTLIFDVTLVAYYHPGATVPDFKAKDGPLWEE